MICPICNNSFTPRTAQHSICGLVCYVAMKKQKEENEHSAVTSYCRPQVGRVGSLQGAYNDSSQPPPRESVTFDKALHHR